MPVIVAMFIFNCEITLLIKKINPMGIKSIVTALLVSIALSSFGQKEEYYMSKRLDIGYEQVITKLNETVKEHGFGIVDTMMIHKSLSTKLPDVEMSPYVVLGVCNAKIAWQSIQQEPNIGLFMPCKVIVKYVTDTSSEVIFVKPTVTMSVVDNAEIQKSALEITQSFEKIMQSL